MIGGREGGRGLSASCCFPPLQVVTEVGGKVGGVGGGEDECREVGPEGVAEVGTGGGTSSVEVTKAAITMEAVIRSITIHRTYSRC